MIKPLFLVFALSLMNLSCTNLNDFDIKSNVSSSEFIDNVNYGILNVNTVNICELDFGITYQARGYSEKSASCEIQIIKSGKQYIIRTIEMSRSKAFSKTFTHKVSERILAEIELNRILHEFKKCEELPKNISVENPCMHDTFFDIKIKNKETHWMTHWCSNHTYKYSKKYADYKRTIQKFENFLLELAEITSTKKMLIIDNIPNNDSLRIQAFPTYGLKVLNAKYEFDNIPISTDRDGVGEIILHPKDTMNWKNRIKVYEIRKDSSIHEVKEK